MAGKTGTIGILTGGGDVPGLNPAIRAVTIRALREGWQVIGIRRGWAGLVDIVRDQKADNSYNFQVLTEEIVNKAGRTGGTFLHTSRTNPSKVKRDRLPPYLQEKYSSEINDLTPEVLQNLDFLGIDYLVPIGGDDTLSYAVRMFQEGVKVVAIPKTMDNDVQNTEYCIGFSTAITRAESAIQRQRTTVGSHERIGIFRVFGRDAGYTALYTAYVTNIRCVIPEYRVDLDKLIELLVKDKRENPSNYSLVILSEGAEWHGYETVHVGEADAYGHQKKVNVGDVLASEVKNRSKEETIVSDLTYDLRSGDPDFIDKLIATTFGNMAMDALADGKSGLMTGITGGCFDLVEIPDPARGPRKVDVPSMYNTERYRPIYDGKRGLPIFLTRA